LRKAAKSTSGSGTSPGSNYATGWDSAQPLVFAALGDATRLALVARLARGHPLSIARLTRGSRLTRQAVTKHLEVLRRAGLVRSLRSGRENHFALDPRPFKKMEAYLEFVSRQWDQALDRLKSFVEE
jgi:DNA-binding transcriptional ArsR family regulator